MILTILTIILSIIIIALILVQGKGAGLGSAWGGSGESYQTRRGVERWIMVGTGILVAVFFVLSIINLII